MSAEQSVFTTLTKGGVNPDTAKIIVAQAKHESDDFKSPVCTRNNNAFGMTFPAHRSSPYIVGRGGSQPAADGKGVYAKYDTLEDSALDLLNWFAYNNMDVNDFNSPAAYVHAIKSKGYFGDLESKYLAGVNRKLATLGGLVASPARQISLWLVAALGLTILYKHAK